MTRPTAHSLPGIAWAESTTMSSLLTLNSLCSWLAMRASALMGSPCEPVQIRQTSPGA